MCIRDRPSPPIWAEASICATALDDEPRGPDSRSARGSSVGSRGESRPKEAGYGSVVSDPAKIHCGHR
eukprot:6074453-Pyramimonas_sp.AAC.1